MTAISYIARRRVIAPHLFSKQGRSTAGMEAKAIDYNVRLARWSPAARIALAARKRMFSIFTETCRPREDEKILDVGVTGDRRYEGANYFEEWYPYKGNITAVGLEDASFLEDEYPGLRFVEANGCDLPFDDNEFAVTYSSAVWEHVGSWANQKRFLSELRRVTSRCVFMTTPDRAFPIEVHTLLPVIHWLPKGLHRKVLKRLGHADLAEEGNLNLLSVKDVRKLCGACGVEAYDIRSLRTAGFPSNILLTVHQR